MQIQRVSVVGAGTMGNGIAQVFASAGVDVQLIDTAAAAVQRAVDTIGGSLERLVRKEKISAADRQASLERIRTSTKLTDAKDADLVVEAVFESFEVKKRIFEELDGACGGDCILASNTSSISITQIAAVTRRPEKVVGMHFFNPVPIMKLVEIIRGEATTDETYRIIEALAKRVGKVPVEVQDYPGFISNRVLMPMINEAISALQEGVADRDAFRVHVDDGRARARCGDTDDERGERDAAQPAGQSRQHATAARRYAPEQTRARERECLRPRRPCEVDVERNTQQQPEGPRMRETQVHAACSCSGAVSGAGCGADRSSHAAAASRSRAACSAAGTARANFTRSAAPRIRVSSSASVTGVSARSRCASSDVVRSVLQ
jgi:3-hydroxybutyryl-CoA dehydrogenase